MSRNHGFAGMDKEEQRKIASMGGKKTQEGAGVNRFTSKTGKKAGRKGGKKVSADPKFMSRIGRKGGLASAAKRKVNSEQDKSNKPGDATIRAYDLEYQ
ncbi:stress-induced protein [Candidatus Parcubacteria bacterium]|nr:stress-induced protein [Candidatus Parcubacteria bacterium]